jgi:multiple sugar transport system substrate-binding protein
VQASRIVPPRVAPPCRPGRCPFAGQTVTVLMVKEANAGSLGELKEEFEAATGATLDLVQVTHQELFPNFMSDLTNGTGKYDAAYAGAWWLGELVAGDYLVSYAGTTRIRASRNGTSSRSCRHPAVC